MTVATPGVLVLAGPTASGKTELALELAERFGAEIVGADSRQIYRGMPIGTAVPTAEQRARVPHHLVEMLEPTERYSAARFVADALAAIASLAARGKRTLVVGGTGFYVRALCGDVVLSSAYDPELRARLAREARLHPPAALHDWLRSRDPVRAARLSPNDGYRVLRALEIALTRDRAAVRAEAASLRSAGITYAKTFLDVAGEELHARIEDRVGSMLERGFVDEALRIGPEAVAADAVGYPHAFAYAAGACTAAELRALLARETRRYARRQCTWFRSEPGVTWIERGAAADTLLALARKLPGWG
jgi:tRNA dimethylallyltransferase